ncbi:MAG: spermidine synthase [Gammaproteobacteria bacterium]
MSRLFAELDYRETPIGALSLRRRRELRLDQDVWEIKLDDEFLMSSLFTVSEVALARLGLGLHGGTAVDVVVGGLGLGYTAATVLEQASVNSLIVIEYLQAVIDWHAATLLPLGRQLCDDPRCRLLQADFFACAAAPDGFDPDRPGRRFHAILLDIDHSPDAWLDDRSRGFYTVPGLTDLARHLLPGGVFGLWSNEAPDGEFLARLRAVFADARAEAVRFHNPLQDSEVTQTVYLGRTAAA